MRFTLCSVGSHGDVAPFLALGRALADRGSEVVVAAPVAFAADAAEAGLDFQPIAPWFWKFGEEACAAQGSTLKLLAAFRRAIKVDRYEEAERLFAIAEGSDALIATGLAFSAAHVAEALGIPYRFVTFCPRGYPSAHHPNLSNPSPRGLPILNTLEWRMDGLFFDPPLGAALNPWRRGRGLSPAAGFMHRTIGRPGERVLAADEVLAPLPPDVQGTRRVCAIRPLQSDSLPGEVEEFVSAGDPPVFVGFGSVLVPDAKQVLGDVLESSAALKVRTIIPSSWADAAKIRLPDGCLAVGSVPHSILFPRIAVVVHHGGAGTTTTAARAGVPQVLVPNMLDQHYWGHRVRELGVGPRPIRVKAFSARRLTEALRETLGSDEMVERARSLSEQLGRRDGAHELATLLTGDS